MTTPEPPAPPAPSDDEPAAGTGAPVRGETHAVPGDTGTALRERVKELTCLYELSQLSASDDLGLDEVLGRAARILPPACLHPDAARARVSLDGRVHGAPGFPESPSAVLSAPILVDGVRRGTVEVAYEPSLPPRDEGPFLREERHLIDAVGRKLGLLVERIHARDARDRLQEQLLHADRLATIGRLTAGLAHEMNEPLAAVVGFAQLARKCPGLPDAAARDVGRVLAAALHAREVVRKLMLFARRTPPRVEPADLAALADEGLAVVEGRCTAAGIRVVRDFRPDVPRVAADPSQVRQVVVNLAVNAVQAMPAGGTLTVRLRVDGRDAVLEVEDTGVGMSADVLDRIFVPFFTTKEVGEGTGLGLSVVHGIVSSHGGRVSVRSRPGHGSCFEVRLPANGRTLVPPRGGAQLPDPPGPPGARPDAPESVP